MSLDTSSDTSFNSAHRAGRHFKVREFMNNYITMEISGQIHRNSLNYSLFSSVNSSIGLSGVAGDASTMFFGTISGGITAELTGEDGALRKCLVDIFSEWGSMRRERQGAATGLAVSALNHVAYKMQGNTTEYANDNGKKKRRSEYKCKWRCIKLA